MEHDDSVGEQSVEHVGTSGAGRTSDAPGRFVVANIAGRFTLRGRFPSIPSPAAGPQPHPQRHVRDTAAYPVAPSPPRAPHLLLLRSTPLPAVPAPTPRVVQQPATR